MQFRGSVRGILHIESDSFRPTNYTKHSNWRLIQHRADIFSTASSPVPPASILTSIVAFPHSQFKDGFNLDACTTLRTLFMDVGSQSSTGQAPILL